MFTNISKSFCKSGLALIVSPSIIIPIFLTPFVIVGAHAHTSNSLMNSPSSYYLYPSATKTNHKTGFNYPVEEQPCVDDCDDIDAVRDLEAFNDLIEDNDFSTSSTSNSTDAAAINSENSIQTDNEPTSYDDLTLKPDEVALNAISPQTIQTFVEVIDIVRKDYVQPVNDEALFQHAISGMLEKLDSHAEYLTPEQYEQLRSFTDGEIGEVGITAQYDFKSNNWIIKQVAPRSSAQLSGVNKGDKLLKIKKIELTHTMSKQDIEQLLTGIAGSQIQVTLEDKQGVKRNVTLQRNLTKNNTLEVRVQDGIAIVRLPVFQNSSKSQLISALSATDQPITGIVLDIRNNPGGVLTSALDIASLFIVEEDLIRVKNRTNSGQFIKPNGTPYLSDLPVVVIQNKYSASAAEVLSSSFKSNKRADIIGEKSFGKGTVQEVVSLKSGGAVKITVAEYSSAKGEVIDGVGIAPDIYLFNDGTNWQQYAVELLLSKDRAVGIQFNNNKLNNKSINDY